MEIGKIISQLRNDKGLNQRELAIHLGVSNGAIGMWETGKRQPDLETIKKIASFFNVSVDYLLGNTSDSETTSSEAPGNGCENSINYWIAKTGLGNNEIAKQPWHF